MGVRPTPSQDSRLLLRIAFDINVAKEGVAEAITIESGTGLDSMAMEHLRVACCSLESAIDHLKNLRRDYMLRWD
jgi:hypothetical protein